MQTRLKIFLFAWLVSFTAAYGQQGGGPLIELEAAGHKVQGRLVAKNSKVAWLLARDGSLHQVLLKDVSSFRRVSPTFRSYSPAQIKVLLFKEFGKGYQIVGTRHYLVCAKRGASDYAELLEKLFRNYYLYFRTRGFKLREPDFPLIAVVFDSRSKFEEYCRRDGGDPDKGLVGYYLRTSNRIALYETAPTSVVTSSTRFVRSKTLASALHGFQMSDDVRSTLVHEAVHQFAFNVGLHSRLGQTPLWVIEGLATVLEPTGGEQPRMLSHQTPINRERFIWFRHFVKTNRPPHFLKNFLQNDDLFSSAPLDAYSEAWALTYYLLEHRARSYFAYLRKTATRPPLQPYTAQERLADFTQNFGPSLDYLEGDYLRFFSRLQPK